jgi:5,5'-dehydrodivanillate O-demethylase oxygenase subunit
MLTQAENDKLTQVGPGTPMGDLLRRYWTPIAAITEFTDKTIKPVRLLGEDLVLYRDLSGTFGLVDRQCPHRRADLSYGFVEQCGLRCSYHGWAYDESGACIEQPYDDLANPKGRFKDKIRIKSYPVKELAGMVWAYMGPQPAPELPVWEPFTWGNGFAQIVISEVPCNWFQCQENSIDPVHFEWMHHNWPVRMRGGGADLYGPKHTKVGFDEDDYGFIYRRVREDTDEDHEMWSVGRMFLWPHCFYLGDHFEWRVPVDDVTTLSITWTFVPVPPDRRPYVQTDVPHWFGAIKDEKTGRWLSRAVMNQDFVAWVGQGAIADRTKENLGPSDKGIAMIRRRFFQDMDAIARGEDPKAVIRDSEAAKCVALPTYERELLVNGLTLEQMAEHTLLRHQIRGYIYQEGQPDAVWRDYAAAMGLPAERPGPMIPPGAARQPARAER